MTARAPGTVSSTSRFHLRVRCGGQSTRMRRKPAMWAAAAAMKVLPVPISPTTVVLTLFEGNPTEPMPWDGPWDNGPSTPNATAKQALVRMPI